MYGDSLAEVLSRTANLALLTLLIVTLPLLAHSKPRFPPDSKDWQQVVRTLNDTALALERRAHWGEAAQILANAEAIADEHPEVIEPERLRTLNLLGYIHVYLDRPADAQVVLRKALALSAVASPEARARSSDTYYLLGLNYERRGLTDSARTCLREALEVRRMSGHLAEPGSIGVLIEAGNVESDLGSPESAVILYTEALSLITRLHMEHSYEAATCYHVLAQSYAARADIGRAVDCEERALQVARALYGGTHPSVASSYLSLGSLYDIRGDYVRAQEYYQQALGICRSLGGGYGRKIAWIQQKLASVHGESGDWDLALKTGREAFSTLCRELGEKHPDVAAVHSDLAFMLLKAGNNREALAHIDSALSIHRALGTAHSISSVRLCAEKVNLLRATAEGRSAMITAGLTDVEKAARQDPVLAAASCRRFGDAIAKQEPDRALRCYERALGILRPGWADTSREAGGLSSLNGNEFQEALIARARVLESIYRRSRTESLLEASLRSYRSAASLAPALRSACRSEAAKLAVNTRTIPVYDDGIQAGLELYRRTRRSEYLRTALWFSEGSKAGVLQEGIAESRRKHLAGIPDSLLERERNLQDGISYLERQIVQRDLRDSAQSALRLPARLFAAHRELDSLRALMQKRFPQLTAVGAPDIALRVPELQEALDARSGLLEYFCGGKSITIFLVRKSSVETRSIPRPRDLVQIVRTYLRASKTADFKTFLAASARLYDLLLRPLESQIRNLGELVIIPDDLLLSVPFESLVSGGVIPAGADYSRVGFLIRAHAISYSYSVEGWLRSRNQSAAREHSRRETFVGFAPVFSDSVGNGTIAAAGLAQRQLGEEQLRSVTVDGKKLVELPYSQVEISSIAKSFLAKGEPSVTYIHSLATKTRFEREVSDARFVHLATHGVTSEAHPELSALFFSQPRDSESGDDGVLYSNEVATLNINADLLVLSSCESGVGRLVRGEGMMAVTRGFFQAGARNVMVSLWKVLDESTSRLMLRFYQSVIGGDSYPAALREAKMNMIRDPRTAAPARWAGFILIGD